MLEAVAMDGKRMRAVAFSLLHELRSTGAVRALTSNGVHQPVAGGAPSTGPRSNGDDAPSLLGAAASLNRGDGTTAAHSSCSDPAAGRRFDATSGLRAVAPMRSATRAEAAPEVESVPGAAAPAVDASRRGIDAAVGATGVGAALDAAASTRKALRAAPVVVADETGPPHAGSTTPDASAAGRSSLTIVGFRSYAPAQVAAAVAAVACVHLSAERQVDLTRAISLAADEGTIDGNIVLDAPEEEVVSVLLALSRRSCRGAIPRGTWVRVLRFIRAQR